MTEKDEQSHIAEIKRLHGELQSLATDALNRAIRIGELLCDVKPKLGHGGWLPWLQCNISFSERTAQNYMALFQNRTLLKSANIADLTEAYLKLGGQSGTSNGVGVSKTARSIAKEACELEATKQSNSWTQEDLKEDKQLLNAFKAIDAVYGHDDTRAIRTGLTRMKRADVLFLGSLPREKMMETQGLVMGNQWKPKHALEFMSGMMTDRSRVAELINWCIGSKGKFTADIGGFRITCERVLPYRL